MQLLAGREIPYKKSPYILQGAGSKSKRDDTAPVLRNAVLELSQHTISFLPRFFEWFPAGRRESIMAFDIDGKSVYCIGSSLTDHADAIVGPS